MRQTINNEVTMKKKLVLLLSMVMTASVISGCATNFPVGALYTNTVDPWGGNVGSGAGGESKVGKAESQSYLGLIAVGDSSIRTAARNGGITRIKYVERKTNNILGFIGKYTTYVYGD